MEQDVFVKHECPCKLKFVFGGKNTCLPPCCQLKSFKAVALTVIYEEFWQNPKFKGHNSPKFPGNIHN